MRRAGIAAVSAALVVCGTWLNGQASAEKALQIADGMQVTLEYTLTLPDKTVADSTAGQAPFSYVHGGHQVVYGLEKALAGLKAGDKKRVTILALEAYGLYDKTRIITVPKKNVPREAKVGVMLRSAFFFQAEDGIRDLTVTGVQTCALPIFSDALERIGYGRIRAVVRR